MKEPVKIVIISPVAVILSVSGFTHLSSSFLIEAIGLQIMVEPQGNVPKYFYPFIFDQAQAWI